MTRMDRHKKTNRKIIRVVLLACTGLVILSGFAADALMDDYMRNLMKRSYAEYDRACPQSIDSITLLESVRFSPETWMISRSLHCLDMDSRANDSVSLYKLDTLVRDRKERIKERMRTSGRSLFSSDAVAAIPSPLARYLHRRTSRKLSLRTLYYDKRGDFIMEITFTPEDYKELRETRSVYVNTP